MRERTALIAKGWFIVEGEVLVKRLLRSDFQVHSILISERRLCNIFHDLTPAITVLAAPEDILAQVVGYDFHRGVLACGVRKPAKFLSETTLFDEPKSLVVICPEINDSENLGAILRSCAAFGIDAVILGERCSDPFYRRCIRVSMGAVFTLPILHSLNLQSDLKWLHDKEYELVASVLSSSAMDLHQSRRRSKMAVLLGNEAKGLALEWLRFCDRQVTIPMQGGTDSLNVAVAAGIFLYHYSQQE